MFWFGSLSCVTVAESMLDRAFREFDPKVFNLPLPSPFSTERGALSPLLLLSAPPPFSREMSKLSSPLRPLTAGSGGRAVTSLSSWVMALQSALVHALRSRPAAVTLSSLTSVSDVRTPFVRVDIGMGLAVGMSPALAAGRRLGESVPWLIALSCDNAGSRSAPFASAAVSDSTVSVYVELDNVWTLLSTLIPSSLL